MLLLLLPPLKVGGCFFPILFWFLLLVLVEGVVAASAFQCMWKVLVWNVLSGVEELV